MDVFCNPDVRIGLRIFDVSLCDSSFVRSTTCKCGLTELLGAIQNFERSEKIRRARAGIARVILSSPKAYISIDTSIRIKHNARLFQITRP